MAAKTLGDFTLGTTSTIQTDDFIVGYDTAVAGGERRWTLSTIANAVSGLIKTEMANYMNNTLTLGNYPYLEYAYVTTAGYAGQLFSTVDSIETININTKVQDTQNIGANPSANIMYLPSGTYTYEIIVPWSIKPSTCANNHSCTANLYLYDSSNLLAAQPAGSTSTNATIRQFVMSGVFKLTQPGNLTIALNTTAAIYVAQDDPSSCTTEDDFPSASTTPAWVSRCKFWKVG